MTESQFEGRLRTILEAYSLPGRRIAYGAQQPLVLLKDDQGKVLLSANNVVPVDGTAGFAKGALHIKTDAAAGVSGLYENRGTITACAFKVLGGFIAADDALTTSREWNSNALTSGMTMANEARGDIIAHFANATRHTVGQQSTAGIAPVATNLATLLTLTGSILALYATHNADFILAGGWAFHNAQGADQALVSSVAPTTLEDAVTKLTDLRAKWNAHEAEAVGHAGVGSVVANQISVAAPTYGSAIVYPLSGALAGDRIFWSILDPGAGAVTGVSAIAGTDIVTFSFSADPGNDTILSFMAMRN